MWDLLWSILFSSLIFVVFKLFDTYGVSTFHAIVVNYITAFITGLMLYGGELRVSAVMSQSWLPGALVLGGLFIVIFNVMARTSQRLGVSVASIATKMSLVIPVVAGIHLYDERLSLVQIFGILLALVAVYFTSQKDHMITGGRDLRILYLPLLVFLGSGIIDTSIKYMQETHVSPQDYPLFSSAIFGFAALAGILTIIIRSRAPMKHISGKNLVAGIALGVPNYFSVYFLLRALRFEGLNSAEVFTLNNVSIVLLTTMLGILLFRERLRWKNWLGVGLAVISILLISMY